MILGSEGAMANSDHVVGSLVITVAIIATAEVARALRFINVALGAWLIAAPFLLTGVGHVGAIMSVVVGIELIGLSLPRGKRSAEHYASWDKYVIRGPLDRARKGTPCLSRVQTQTRQKTEKSDDGKKKAAPMQDCT